MAAEKAEPSGPDLAQGIALSAFTSETLLGHVGDQDVLLVRFGPEGKIVERWNRMDEVGLMTQLGLMPAWA